MSDSKLILTPVADQEIPSLNKIIPALVDIELIRSTPLEHGSCNRYLPGSKFMQLITFLGCSPYVRLEPEDEADNQFCHVRFSPHYPEKRFRAGRNRTTPRCPNCGHKLAEAYTLLERSTPDECLITCDSCSTRTAATAIDWRQSAGFGSFFIEIWGIFPGEAVPSQTLMDCLSELGCEWHLFYLQEDPGEELGMN